MHFTKALAMLALACSATALPTVETLAERQTNGGTTTGTNATPCGQSQGYLACCNSPQSSSSSSVLDSIVPFASPALGALAQLLNIPLTNLLTILLPAQIQTAINCTPILSGQTTVCTQTQQCCFSGPTSQVNGNSFISLFNNNNIIFCPNFVVPVAVPITG